VAWRLTHGVVNTFMAPTEGAVKLAPELAVNLRGPSKTFGPPNENLSQNSSGLTGQSFLILVGRGE
jgi:hypothetical protein